MDAIRTLAGRYEVHRLLGRGGMAEVHEGVDTRLGRRVAIKLLRSDLARDPSFHERLRREAQAAASLNHPSAVAVYDSGEEQVYDSGGAVVHVPYIVMEYVEGKTLREVLQEHGHLTVQESLDVIAGVLAPLRHSHDQGIVHRDIKPANVMLTPEGDVKVMDFGIARAIADNSSVTQTSAVVGTAQYLSPEQARGEVVDARTDLYSTACLLYELLTGRPPFLGDSPLAVAYQHVGETPVPPSAHVPDIPAAVDRLVLHALDKDRDRRYQNAHTFREDALAARDGRPLSIDSPDDDATQAMTQATRLAPAAIGAPTQAMAAAEPGTDTGNFEQVMGRPPEDEEELEEKEKSRKGWWIFGTILLLLALGALGWFVYELSRERPPEQVEIVDLERRDPADAQAYLQELGLEVAQDEEPSDEIDEGLVTRTDPAAGTLVDVGSTVTVFVSTGPDVIAVPDVSGETESRARQLLEQAGLEPGSNIEENSPDVRAGDVIETRPEADREVRRGSTVDLVLSTGRVEVPDVTGAASADEACGILEGDDYQLGCRTEDVETDEHDPGTVVSQSTSGGETVEQGATITLEIAVEPPEPEPSPTEDNDNGNNGGGEGGGNRGPRDWDDIFNWDQ
ncbi:Stk1 family PASTA domain-containing Ser/Thr kinase [Sediminivirga luteola]|uniref:non-specific serine/threonine protein kinase n=1 Tax=Sediminivirga luteola TaxID=1774748 RepID=A0A8J2TZC9_9MICO|nr:Stk1 family PASTA domain-containing Ser/Thr kinase [Sediminivirga luteola]GGA19793.1 protein kinase [Sediminivirga luteola]